jgi:D-alanyl-D-alanine dipeptidase
MLIYKKYNTIPVIAILTIIVMFLTACVNRTSEVTSETNESPPAVSNKEDNLSTTPIDSNENEPEESKPYEGDLELPVDGATGYASVSLELKASPNSDSNTIETLEAGTAFEIVREEGDWWFIKRGESTGWLPHKYCFINLPDVIPSMIYDNTNTYSSKFTSSGKTIPNVSNLALYSGRTYNERLQKEEYIMPVLYSMSKKINKAQQHALSEGNSLKLYEGYRPYFVQKAVVKGLTELANNDVEVMKGINTPPWGITWFIVDGVSNHQMGYGIDVSLVKVNSKKEISIGNYTVIEITNYTEYMMPTQIHELSGASAIFTTAVTSLTPTAWKNATYSDSMNEAAINLQKYTTTAGLTPLASEWWHFNDLEARDEIADNSGEGTYILTEIFSSSPQN